MLIDALFVIAIVSLIVGVLALGIRVLFSPFWEHLEHPDSRDVENSRR